MGFLILISLVLLYYFKQTCLRNCLFDMPFFYFGLSCIEFELVLIHFIIVFYCLYLMFVFFIIKLFWTIYWILVCLLVLYLETHRQ